MTVFSEAARAINERGWHKGDYVNESGAVCALGAIAVAQGREPKPCNVFDPFTEVVGPDALTKEEQKALIQAILDNDASRSFWTRVEEDFPDEDFDVVAYIKNDVYDALYTFNDDAAELEDIQSIFKTADYILSE